MIRNDDLFQRPTVGEHGACVLVLDPGQTTGYVGGLIPNSALLRMGVEGWLETIALDPLGIERVAGRIVDIRDWKTQGNPVIGKRHCAWFRYGQIDATETVVGGSYLEQEKEAVRRVLAVGREMCIDARKLSRNRLPALTHVVAEDFVLQEHTQLRNLLSPVRITTGVYNWLSSSSMFDVEFHLSQVGSAKHLVDDDALKRLGLFHPGMTHANDACRHFVLFVRSYYNQLTRIERAR